MLATSAGIGLFLAFTGLLATQGLGLSVYSGTTVVTIGALRQNVRPRYTYRSLSSTIWDIVCSTLSSSSGVSSMPHGSRAFQGIGTLLSALFMSEVVLRNLSATLT